MGWRAKSMAPGGISGEASKDGIRWPSRAFVGDEFEVFDEFVVGGFPLGLVPDGEVGVALEGEVSLDEGDVHAVGFGEGFVVDFGAAGDEAFGFAGGFGEGEGFVEGGEPFDAFDDGGVGVSGDDEVSAAGEGAADGGEGFAAHDHGVSHGGGAEAFEVFGEIPGETAGGADEAVRGHGNNDRNEHSGFRRRT